MTVIEVTERKANLENTVKESQAKLKGLKPFSDDFDKLMSEYLKAKNDLTKIDAEFDKAKIDEAQNAVKEQCITIGTTISKLLEAYKIADLIKEPVKTVVYVVDSEGKVSVNINKITKLASKGTGTGKVGKGHVKIVDAQGQEQSVTAFIKANATAAELTTAAFKYPHTQADTKAKFDEFVKAHNLTGFEYKMPVEATTEETQS